MSFVKRHRNESRQPTEKLQVSENLEIAVWQAVESNGARRLHWNFSRINPQGGSYKTLRVQDLLQLPSAIAVLAAGFKQIPSLPGELRDALSKLGELMVQVDSQLEGNGLSTESTDQGPTSIFGRS
jgi:hypothetical protein